MQKIIFLLLLIFCLTENILSQQTVQNSGIFWAPITINNISAWYSSDGRLEATHANAAGNSVWGGIFPRNTASTIYTSAFMYSADSPLPIVNGAYYTNTLQHGAIFGQQTGLAENKLANGVRIWRIRKDFMTADLRRDASVTYGIAENNVSIMDMQRLRTEYKKNWLEWPAIKGAPFYDVNNNGIYDPKFTLNQFNVEIPDTNSDSPGVANADQVIWYVCNDLGGDSPWDTPSIGMEMQVTIWAYATNGALANTIFRRGRMIYKGTASTPALHTLTNMYIGIWSDIDLGQTNDNLAGSDPELGLGYVYNSKTLDNEYSKFNLVPPSVGFDIVQGPKVKSTSLDSALFNFSYRKGYKNLPVTSITYIGQANGTIFTGSTGISHLTNALQGLPTRSSSPQIDPITSKPSKFWASGDPLLKTGWIDGVYENPGSRELIVSTGPFTMTLGDSQEIVTTMIASQAPDRLAGVSVLKYYDKIVQDSYSKLTVPAPSLPSSNASLREFDRTILIEWEKDTAVMNRTEKFSSKGYVFEGYNIYQLSTLTSPRYEWKRIATYDLKNDITQIVQDDINLQTGRVELQLKQEGKNSGISRTILLTRDSLGNRPLINGQQYYFALTSYGYTSNQSALLRTIESEPQILYAVPHVTNPEIMIPYSLNDSLTSISENIIGDNDGRVGVKIIDPYSISGGTYDLWYGKVNSNYTWTMVRDMAGSDYAEIKTKLTASELTVPRPNPLPATNGTGSFLLNDARNRISYSFDLNTSNLFTTVEIYRGAKNSNGTLLKSIAASSKHITGYWTNTEAVQPLTDSIVKDLIAGYCYVIVRTTTYPNGEMRGQLSDGATVRATLPLTNVATSSRSIFTFDENRFPNEGFSLYVSPAPNGFKSAEQIMPSRSNVINVPNNEGTYSLIGPGYSWEGYNNTESKIEIRFTNDTNWAIITAKLPIETKFMRVPFQIYQDTVRVWPVIANGFSSDSVWNTMGNPFQNGKPIFDKIAGIVNKADGAGIDISYNSTIVDGVLPSRTSTRGRLINELNHIAKNISFVNIKEDGIPPPAGTRILLTPFRSIKYGDIKRVILHPVQKGNVTFARQQVNTINVFPNPYYGVNIFEKSATEKFVTFSHLPEKTTIKIFNLAGIHARTLYKNDPEQFFRWDLRNENGFFVASGLYVIYIDMGNIGIRTLKLAVIMENQNLNTF